MRSFILAALLLGSFAVASSFAQSGDAASQKKPKLLTLVGCVSSDESTPGHYTIADSTEGVTYRLSGRDMKTYVGRRVQLTGAPSSRFSIGFGLTPSPNAAAQAGAVDPPPAAAATPARPDGMPRVEDFRIKTVKPVVGDCPPK